ncbi:glycoside hydrolase 5 family protein [Microbispora siamensis]
MSRLRRLRTAAAAVAVLTVLAGLMAAPATASAATGMTFVKRVGTKLTITSTGKQWRFAGTNDSMLVRGGHEVVDSVFDRAQAAGLGVIRTFGSVEIGDEDGSNSVFRSFDLYFQYWDGTKPAYNDDADGLENLDYVLWRARQSGFRVIIPFVNNWIEYSGGMDQYVRWAGGQYHDDFYTNSVIKGWYKDWITHLLNRVNTLTGVAYKDDPTIMAWELANAPRCKGSDDSYPTSSGCTAATITAWADEMSQYVKSVDGNHLLSVGDEGFYCTDPGGPDWTNNCSQGVDTLALARLPEIDLMSPQLFADKWGKDAAWGTSWITQHLADGREIGKPVVLSAFGLLNKSVRNPAYRDWLNAFRTGGGAGFAFWAIIEGLFGDNFPDLDGYTVNCPSPVCKTIENAGYEIHVGKSLLFPPVADDDNVVTDGRTAVMIDVTANDIAYRHLVDPSSIDLDPQTEGRQTSVTVTGGTFTTDASGKVVFTPTDGFTRRATAKYVVRDDSSSRKSSNVARISVTVKPDPDRAVKLFSFEDGVQGWAPGRSVNGTVTQSTEFATDGTHSLRVEQIAASESDGGTSYGAHLPEPVDLSAKGTLKYDLKTGASWTWTYAVLLTGPDLHGCGSATGSEDENSTVTVEISLVDSSSCTTEDLKDVRGLYLWFNPGTFYIDNIRAE